MWKKRSIQVEVLLVLLPLVLVAMAFVSIMGYNTSRGMLEDAIHAEMELHLEVVVEKIEKSLSNNRKIAEALARAVEVHSGIEQTAGQKVAMPVSEEVDGETFAALSDTWNQSLQSRQIEQRKDLYSQMLTSLAKTNEETFGGGIWFEPYAFDPSQQYFSPYCMRENGEIIAIDDYTPSDGVYTEQDWYTKAEDASGGAVWSAPYFDTYTQTTMVTASVPFYTAQNKLLGVTTIDIDLGDMQKMVLSHQTGIIGKAFLLDENGTYIADVDSEKMMKTKIQDEKNPSLVALGKVIQSQKNGKSSFELNGQPYQAWFAQVPECGWTIVIASSEAVLFKRITELGQALGGVCIIFTLLVMGVLILYTRKAIVRPLKQLANVTTQIADGHLDVDIVVKQKNEIGVVLTSIQRTSSRLKLYIDYIAEISGVLDQISKKNLDIQLALDYAGEFSKLREGIENIQTSLNQTMRSIDQSARQVNTGASQVAAGAQALASGASQQADAVQRLSASVSDVSNKAEENSRFVQQAVEYLQETGNNVQESNSKMKQLQQAMQVIEKSSDQIAHITKAIEDIAFQTNILSLNAAIEAARAGHAGKGFAVVAEEVRVLAEKSAHAAKQTEELVRHSVQSVQEGMRFATDTEQVLNEVVESSDRVVNTMQSVQQASNDQAEAIAQITQGVHQISEVVQTNAATAEESSASSEELSAQAEILQKEVESFRLAKGKQAPIHALASSDTEQGMALESTATR